MPKTYRIKPIDTIVSEIADRLDATLREDFEERAGIIEFDAKTPRAHAECLALLDVLRRKPAALSGVTVLQVEIDHGTQWLLTTDLQHARQYCMAIGAREIGVVDLANVLDRQYRGLAMLSVPG